MDVVYFHGSGWLYLYVFISLSAGVVEGSHVVLSLYCTIPKVTLVVALFVIFGGHFSILVYRYA